MSNHQPAKGRLPADRSTAGLTISQAAQRLGVSENAIRQRIKRGTLHSEKVAGVWRINLSDHDGDYHADQQPTTSRPSGRSAADHEPIEAEYRVSPAEIELAIERTGERYVSDMQTMVEEVGRLYEAQLIAKNETIAAQADTIREARRRADDLERERDALQSRVSDLEATTAEGVIEGDTVDPGPPQRAWWAFWKK